MDPPLQFSERTPDHGMETPGISSENSSVNPQQEK